MSNIAGTASSRSMNISNKATYYKIIIVLGAMAAVMPMSIDMYLPGFAKVANTFQTDVAHIGITLSSFFAGVCIGQLFYGPLMDKYGRIKPLVVGILIFILASIACGLATSLQQLTIFRFFQAFGGCASFVANRAIARDLFKTEELVKVFSMLMLVIGLAPILAPSLGSFIVAHHSWRVVFWVLTGTAILLLLALLLFIGETKPKTITFSLRPGFVLKNYWNVFSNPSFLLYTLSFSFASAGLFSYVAGSPAIFMGIFKVDETDFGIIFGFNALCLVIGSQLNRFITKKFSGKKITSISSFMLLAISVILFTLTYFGIADMWTMIICLSSILFFTGIFNPNASALALAPFKSNAGTASALSGFMQMMINAFASFAVSYFATTSALPMTSIMMICAVCSFTAVSIVNFWNKEEALM